MLSFIGQIYGVGLEWNDAVIYGLVTRYLRVTLAVLAMTLC